MRGSSLVFSKNLTATSPVTTPMLSESACRNSCPNTRFSSGVRFRFGPAVHLSACELCYTPANQCPWASSNLDWCCKHHRPSQSWQRSRLRTSRRQMNSYSDRPLRHGFRGRRNCKRCTRRAIGFEIETEAIDAGWDDGAEFVASSRSSVVELSAAAAAADGGLEMFGRRWLARELKRDHGNLLALAHLHLPASFCTVNAPASESTTRNHNHSSLLPFTLRSLAGHKGLEKPYLPG